MTAPASVLAPLPVVIPTLAAALLAGARRVLTRAAADMIAIASAGATFAASLVLFHAALHTTIVYWFGGWFPRGAQVIGIDFVIDPVSAALASLASFLALLALVFSWRIINAGANHYQPLMLIFLGAMCGFSLTGDLFNLFVFFELMSTAAFALCGLKTREPAPLQGAFNFAVTNTIAAFMVLTGIGMLYAITGALNLAQLGLALGTRHDATVLFAAMLLTCGFFIKGAIVPFHLWLPDAHAVAPTPVCVLFSGLMVELGLYAVLRIHSVVFAQSFAAHYGALHGILLTLGVVTVLFGAVMCYAEHHLKRLLAFSTISHAGLMLVLFALGGPYAITGMLLYLLAHALVKSGLFFCSGILLHRLRTISETRLFGEGRCLRWTALLWLLGGAGLAAAPPFATMLGDLWAARAANTSWLTWTPYVFIAAGALTGAAVLRVGARVFFGWGDAPISDQSATVDELPETRSGDETVFWFQFVPALLCISLAAGLIFVPSLATDALLAAHRVVDGAAYVHTVYSGSASLRAPAQAGPQEFASAALHGLMALACAVLLAATSVFRLRLPRALRFGAFLEGPLRPLRALQSGHPGDYVLWLTVGVAVIGLAFMALLR